MVILFYVLGEWELGGEMSPQEPMVWQLQTRNKQEFPVAGTGRLRAVLSILYYILFGGRLEAGEIMAWGAECQVWGGGGVYGLTRDNEWPHWW